MLEFGIHFVICYIGLEFIFYLYVQHVLLPKIQPVKPAQESFFKDRVALARECLDLISVMNTYNFEDFIRGWFLYSKVEDIYTGNIDSWLAWVLFVRHFPDLNDDEKGAVLSFRLEMSTKFDVIFKEGFNPAVKHCNFNLETVRIIHHPLIEYAIFNLVEVYSILFKMYAYGFRRYQSSNGMIYWYKKHPDEDGITRRPPIMILHGICFGWMSYAECITKFGKNRDVILLDYSCVRISWINLHVPDNEEVNCCVKEILVQHNIEKVSLLAHSWGTLISVWLLQMSPAIFSHVTFLDPVGMVIFLPEPAYTLMYKPPVATQDYLVCYFVRHNISTATAMYRNLCWFNVTCLLDDIPSDIGVVIGIAAEDELVPARAIKDIVDIHNKKHVSPGYRQVKLICFDKLSHGDTICIPESVDAIVAAVSISEGALS